jgi:prepilin signal peptidase PulO-like enzyme (type II secretory pathway)
VGDRQKPLSPGGRGQGEGEIIFDRLSLHLGRREPVNFILAIPLAVRLLVLFFAGAAAGSLVNWAVYTLAWNRRAISPWSPPDPAAPPRRPSDRMPLVGWFGLAREARWHGRAFWIRPLVVELLAAVAFAGLYYWEVEVARPLWAPPGAVQPAAEFLTAQVPLANHVRYLSHVILISLMLAASLVDLDEKTIPDTITVLGTLVALLLAALYPWSLPPAGYFAIAGQPHVEFLTLASPNGWPPGLGGLPLVTGLCEALFCWTLWCGGLLTRTWKTRRGLATAVRVFFHRLRVEPSSYMILAMWLAGAAAVALAAWSAADARWAALVTSLVGMAAGGGMIWAVRFVGTAALKREAMGFGDVTLVSMIGAFLGWQACLVIFFVAPFLGLAFAVANWVLHREHEIPYGPFLCLAALVVVLQWPAFWDRSVDIFSLGWVVPALLACCLVLLGLLLLIYRLLGQLFARPR